jgi:hypothetical protein
MIIFLLVVGLAPTFLEMGASKILNLTRSYPEQQVMIMDTAASFCYTNNLETGTKARRILGYFTTDPRFPGYACQLFRTDTWLSLSKAGNSSSSGLAPKFWLIGEGEFEKYSELRNSWLELIYSDPVTYIQNKFLFFQKLLIGSDSRNFLSTFENSIFQKTIAIYKFPYEVVIALHLMSILGCFLILIFVLIIRMIQNRESAITIESFTLGIFLSLFLWTLCSAIAFIGSNGRYTYTITLLCFALSLAQTKVESNKKDYG